MKGGKRVKHSELQTTGKARKTEDSYGRFLKKRKEKRTQ
jgi:hypothetical protein